MTKPKKMEGLGFQSRRGKNTALLAKLNRRFHTEEEAPWVKVLRKSIVPISGLSSEIMTNFLALDYGLPSKRERRPL